MAPLSNHTFRRLFTAQVIALIGTGLSTVALSLLAFDIAGGHAAQVLGNALTLKMIAYVCIAPIAGGIAGRFKAKHFLIFTDIARALLAIAVAFVDQVWQIYTLIFLINCCSAGFKPIFQAKIPEILTDEKAYLKALSLSRIAYDLEGLVSPLLAGFMLLAFSYNSLFALNGVAFFISAALIAMAALPDSVIRTRTGGFKQEVTFGVRAYLKTPRLRGLLALFMGVALAGAMLIVNTVVYVRELLGGTETQVAMAMATIGTGSLIGALLLTPVLKTLSIRSVMITGSFLMTLAIGFIGTKPSFFGFLLTGTIVGFGWALVQTPAGQIVNQSAAKPDKAAYFSAQFALSHLCWLAAYCLAGQLGTYVGVQATAFIFSVGILFSIGAALWLWPTHDKRTLSHKHNAQTHTHLHTHNDDHHQHEHEGWEGPEPHSHPHHHPETVHAHIFVIDDHHDQWPK